MTPAIDNSGTGDVLAVMADQFGQLAVFLANGVDEPSHAWWSESNPVHS
jgi:hypothetical protein